MSEKKIKKGSFASALCALQQGRSFTGPGVAAAAGAALAGSMDCPAVTAPTEVEQEVIHISFSLSSEARL